MTLTEVAHKAIELLAAEADEPDMGYTPEYDRPSPTDLAIERLAKENGFDYNDVMTEVGRIYNEDDGHPFDRECYCERCMWVATDASDPIHGIPKMDPLGGTHG